MTYEVRVSCVDMPCLRCRSRGEGAYFLSPVANGVFADRDRAEEDAQRCREVTGRDGRHRYDVCELREDGWPICPWCGEDELYSFTLPATRNTIVGCYRCGTRPPVSWIAAAAARAGGGHG